jgi:hypothetical protein
MSYKSPEAQLIQPLADPLMQDRQVESHVSQVAVAPLRNVPVPHPLEQVPLGIRLVPVGQVKQSVASDPEHVSQVESHPVHNVLVGEMYCPVGHGFTQVLATAP